MTKNVHRILDKSFGKPIHISLGQSGEYTEQFRNLTQKEFNKVIVDLHIKHGVKWSISGDRENRIDLYRQNENIMREGRTIHIGIDINAPAGTPLHAPVDCEVVHAEYESGAGNYGWFIVLKCQTDDGPLYLLFGHLAKNNLARVGTKLRAGDVFGFIGDFDENGNWFHHTHFQVLTGRGLDEGWMYKALCTPEQLDTIDALCPSPMPFVI